MPLPTPKVPAWSSLWISLAALLLLLDIFVFKPPALESVRPVVPADAQDHGQLMEISWLGPPYFAGAREGLWIEELLERRFNIDLKPMFMDPNAYDRKKPLMIAGGNVPDLIWEANPIGLQKSVHHGFVAELPLDLIARTMPVYYRQLTEEAPIAWLYSRVDGANFGIPTMSRRGAEPKPGIWRMDWLRAAGIDEAPQTLEAFEEALRAISYGDPDGNGVQDTYGMSGDISNWWWVAFSEIFGAFGVLPFDWQEVDGEIVWGGTRPEARQAIALLRRWYAEGLIHPEFVTDSMLPGQSLDRKFLSGRTGYLYYRGEHWNLNFTQSGSFAINFLSLQFENLLRKDAQLTQDLFAEIPRALLYFYLSEELVSRTQQIATQIDGVNQTVATWILKTSFSERLLSGRLFEDTADAVLQSAEARLSANQRFFMDLRRSILAETLSGLTPQSYDAFLLWVEDYLNRSLQEAGLPAASTPAQRHAALVDLLNGKALDALVVEGSRWLRERGAITLEAPQASFRSLIISHYGRLQHSGYRKPLLEAAPFPEGPDGHRGGRAWGKASNVLALGAHLKDDPAKVVRILTMLEAMYTDPILAKETISGREGIHWEWYDPVLRDSGPSGTSLKPDFVDPATGNRVDLTGGNISMRYMLNNDVGYFNLLGSTPETASFYSGKAAQTFKETYQREEWGLVNTLGKSDVVPSASDYLADLRMRQQTVYAEIIRGTLPLEAFDAFAEEWMRKGGEQLLQEANALNEEIHVVLEEVRARYE